MIGLAVSKRRAGDWTLLEVVGEIDMASAPTLLRALEGLAASERLAFDLSGVGFLDSSGVRALFDAARAAKETGGEVALVGVSPHVQRVLQITGVESVFRFAPSAEEL